MEQNNRNLDYLFQLIVQPNTGYYERDETNTAMKDMSFMRQMYNVASLYTNIQTKNAAVDQSQPNSRSRASTCVLPQSRVCLRD